MSGPEAAEGTCPECAIAGRRGAVLAAQQDLSAKEKIGAENRSLPAAQGGKRKSGQPQDLA
jgi:hypothetical protein